MALLAAIALSTTACSSSSDDAGAEDPGTTAGARTTTSQTGLDASLFLEGALAEEPSTVECTLSDGTETMCHSLTVAGAPAEHDIGPFCPPTTSSTADEGGIWFDGNGVYDLDGPFVEALADLYGDDNWRLFDDEGNVNITETQEEFEAAARPDVDPELQNHCVAGRVEWLEGGEPIPSTVLIPTSPVQADSSSGLSGNLGVTLDGVVIAAPAPVDAILGAYTIAAFDDCGGHINPIDGYHLHGATGCSEVDVGADAPMIGYALDGYPIHAQLDPDSADAADLDSCGGHSTAAEGYHYHANPAEENAVIECLSGLTVGGDDGGPGGARPPGAPPG